MPVEKPLRRKQPTNFNAAGLHARIDSIQNHTEKRFQAALWYAEQGFYVIPFRQTGRRGFPKGLSQHESTISEKTIRKWWDPDTGVHLDCDLAMSMGGASGYCALDLDVDEEEGKDGITTFAELLSCGYDDEAEALTVMQTTPRGGRHLLYLFHPEIPNDAGFSFKDIDTRGGMKRFPAKDAGVIFVEPTIKHDDDGVAIGMYRWGNEPTTILEVPDWLVDLLNGRRPGKFKLPDLIRKGERDEVLFRTLMSCAGAGYNEDQLIATAEELLKRMEVPDEFMVNKVLQSVMASQVYESAQKERHDKGIAESIRLVLDDKGRPLRTMENLATILSSANFKHEMSVTYDEFYKKLMLNGKIPEKVDFITFDIVVWIQRVFKLEYSMDHVRQGMDRVAREFDRSNALAEYVNQCQKAMPELGYFKQACKLLGIEANPVYCEYLRVWLSGAVARALIPGTKFDYMLIIVGAQGIGKSMFLTELSPDRSWFTDQITSNIATGMGKKDELAKLQAKWIIEMGEMTPFKNRYGLSGDDEIKAFITATHDEYRGAYGREEDAAQRARTCVLAGTTNRPDFLRDITGSRRFLIIDIGTHKIDWNRVPTLRDGLWAEMRDHLERTGRKALVVPEELHKKQEDSNLMNYYMDDVAAELADFVSNRTRFTPLMVLEELKKRNDPLGALKPQEVGTKLRQALLGPNWRNTGQNKVLVTPPNGPATRKRLVWINSDNLYETAPHVDGKRFLIPYMGLPHEAEKT